MANLTLQATSPLGNYHRQFGNTALTEVTHLSIYSIALALPANNAQSAMNTVLPCSWPDTGKSSVNAEAGCHLLGLQSDQVFALLSSEASTQSLPDVGDSAYVTDQSDSWAALRVSGATSRTALERVCPIDLHQSVFSPGSVTRTSMEHLAVIILCEADDQYLLLSPTSSADSFLHAIEISLHNVQD